MVLYCYIIIKGCVYMVETILLALIVAKFKKL
ncbi:MAG: hypothetical protein K0R31_225, partial [Clostridiales bacterium]|nr:hypothetical protein [Clostridiales bacterium]